MGHLSALYNYLKGSCDNSENCWSFISVIICKEVVSGHAGGDLDWTSGRISS